MSKLKRRKRTNGQVANPRSARAMLNTLKTYRDDFGTVTLTQGAGPKALTISVTFSGPQPKAGSKQEKPVKPKPTAIDSLSRTPPVFDWDIH